MKNSKFIYFTFLFLITSCSEEMALPKLPADAVILAFGDSLTYGKGASPDESYPAVLASLSGRQVINAGISGEESAAGLARLPALLDAHQPKLMILCHGGNDFLRKKSIEKLESNLRAMIGLAKSRNIPVVMLGVPKPGLSLSSAEVYGKIAESGEIVFIEDLLADVLGDNSLKSDTVHPNGKGYQVIAEQIVETLSLAGALWIEQN